MKIGNWTDNPCYYVSIVDGKNFALIAGPYRTHQEALDTVEPARRIGCQIDPKSHFYGWGTLKMTNGHQEGNLNHKI